MVYFMEHPIYKWMITGGTPILGKPHIFPSTFFSAGPHLGEDGRRRSEAPGSGGWLGTPSARRSCSGSSWSLEKKAGHVGSIRKMEGKYHTVYEYCIILYDIMI